MSKRPTPPPDEGEGWLVSYADMMTLIACFFILMMAFANYDPVSFGEKAEELSEAFGKGKNRSSEVDLKTTTEEISRHEIKDRLKISLKDSELIVTFSTSLIYKNASISLEDNVVKTLDSLIDILKVSNPNYRILVEGHSDDDLTGTNFKSQWQMSLMRAAEVASRFEYYGFPTGNIVPIGRADTQKINESLRKDGQRDENIARLNRRVVIRVLEPYQKKKVKMGLGVYFRDAVEDVDESSVAPADKAEFNIE